MLDELFFSIVTHDFFPFVFFKPVVSRKESKLWVIIIQPS